jgi:hypothetical protein
MKTKKSFRQKNPTPKKRVTRVTLVTLVTA